MNTTTTPEIKAARAATVCVGCGEPKEAGHLIVCWNCFKYRTDITPLKYYEGTFTGWLETLKTKT